VAEADIGAGRQLKIDEVRLLNVTGGDQTRRSTIYVQIETAGAPKEVSLWQATSDQGRDFRLQTIGKVWKSSPLPHTGSGTYIARVREPRRGWTAFFVELVYDSGLPVPYKFTTQVYVVPDTLPFAK